MSGDSSNFSWRLVADAADCLILHILPCAPACPPHASSTFETSSENVSLVIVELSREEDQPIRRRHRLSDEMRIYDGVETGNHVLKASREKYTSVSGDVRDAAYEGGKSSGGGVKQSNR